MRRLSSGEEYCVCCPECGDKRYRLNVNHTFGSVVNGFVRDKAAKCWNEGCPTIVARLAAMYRVYDGREPAYDGAQAVASNVVDMRSIAAECHAALPQINTAVRVDRLPPEHPAVQYLCSRWYSPEIVACMYGVSYCGAEEYSRRFASHRLLIPMLYSGAVVGVQSRAIPDHTAVQQPKYWTFPGFRKGFFLYDYDRARMAPVPVVMEGPTDVWRVGAGGMALWGRTLSPYQAKQIAETWPDPAVPIIMIADPGFEKDWRRNVAILTNEIGNQHAQRIILLVPVGADPGDMERESVWRWIHAECQRAGYTIPVSWGGG